MISAPPRVPSSVPSRNHSYPQPIFQTIHNPLPYHRIIIHPIGTLSKLNQTPLLPLYYKCFFLSLNSIAHHPLLPSLIFKYIISRVSSTHLHPPLPSISPFYTSSNFKLPSCTFRYFLLPLKTFSYLLVVQYFSLFSASSYPPTLIIPSFTSYISSSFVLFGF